MCFCCGTNLSSANTCSVLLNDVNDVRICDSQAGFSAALDSYRCSFGNGLETDVLLLSASVSEYCVMNI